ncbi:MAG: ABC transporter permease subunit [Spirochaetota bacterium]
MGLIESTIKTGRNSGSLRARVAGGPAARRAWLKDRWLYLMLVPGLFYFAIFKFAPMFGLVLAFENFQPFLGFLKSPWVGLSHFHRFFTEPDFWRLTRNTLIMGTLNILFFFPVPIILALLINELRMVWFKRLVQNAIYVPYFISWVVVAGLTYTFFTTEGGIFNNFLESIGAAKVSPLVSEAAFRPMILLQVIWKESGWGTIIFLAALTGIDPELYQAAEIDGAGRWNRFWHITLPSIRGTIVIVLLLRIGTFFDSGFEQLLLMINSLNRDVGEVLDTFVYQMGIAGGQFSYTTAIGLFKAALALAFVVVANKIAKLSGEEGLF